MLKGFISVRRLRWVVAGVFLCFLGVAVRLYDLHVIERPKLIAFVEKARQQILPHYARRGDITDIHGNVLATSRSYIVLGVDPLMLRRKVVKETPQEEKLRKQDREKWPELARLLGLPPAQLEEIFLRSTPELRPVDGPSVRKARWVKLSESVDESTYEQIATLDIQGVYGCRLFRRVYPGNALAAHVLGFVNKEGEPAGGVESYLNFYLRGQDGWRESEKDGRRRELAQFRTREVPAVDGYTVTLTLDSVIQYMVEEELQHIADKFSPQKATIIVSDPATGFVLGLANYPSFNLNEFNKASLASQRNIAVTDVLEPGSTFKIVAAGGALNEHLVTTATSFDCGLTEIDYKGRTLRLPRDDHPFGRLTVAEIVAHSSNRGAAQLGMLLGEQRLYDYARAFGFAEPTGFPFGGEVSGLLAPAARWSGTDITRIPMGHTIAATPMQIHCAMAAIASGGVLMRPQIIRQIRDGNGVEVAGFEPAPRRRVLTAETAQTLARLLMGVTSPDGTAPEAAIPNFEVAGKTGTAQKLIDGKYSSTHHIGSFVGFFPASHPRLVITVIVDDGHPKAGGIGYGKLVAAPSFKHLGEQLIQYLDIKPAVSVPAAGRFLVMQGGSP